MSSQFFLSDPPPQEPSTEQLTRLMEDPEIHYTDHQVIRASSEDEARQKYNELNHCSYFYGQVLGLIE